MNKPTYILKTLMTPEEIDTCPSFQIENFYWDSICTPRAYGQAAYIQDTGVFIRMTCLESNPLRTYTSHNDPVYLDSAMEAFLQFDDGKNPPSYFNFEINANGAVLAQIGTRRNDRVFLDESEINRLNLQVFIEPNSWTLEFLIPLTLIHHYFPLQVFESGKRFTCNFSKISETPSDKHFGSYAPLVSQKPNFHLPEYFATILIQE